MEFRDAVAYFEKNFGNNCGYRLAYNILDFSMSLPEAERLEFLENALSGIGLDDEEIEMFSKINNNR